MTTAFPLCWPEGWPRCRDRKRAKFSKGERQYSNYGGGSWMARKSLSIAEATKRVLDELGRLGVEHGDAIVSSNLQPRLDGLPRAGQAEPSDPGVAVYWQRRGASMRVMAVDRYDRVADNLAAIAATLEAMRAIERHGGAQVLERAFTGFTALPKPSGADWWEVLKLPRTAKRAEIEARFRRLARDRHPDRGGSNHQMAELNRARDQALAEVKA